MKRYDDNLVENKDGKWFSAAEVTAEIARLQQRIAQLKAVNFLHAYGGSPTRRSALQIGEAMHAQAFAKANGNFRKSAFNVDYAELERRIAYITETAQQRAADVVLCNGSIIDFKAPKL